MVAHLVVSHSADITASGVVTLLIRCKGSRDPAVRIRMKIDGSTFLLQND